MKQNILKSVWQPVIAIMIFIGCWEASTLFFHIEEWVLPAPSVIAGEIYTVFSDFLPHMLSTIKLVITGFLIGTSIGLTMAAILHESRILRQTFYPFLILSQNIPIIVLAPLLLIWFGLGDTPKIIIIAMTAFFPIAVSALSGLDRTNRDLLHYMKMMGATNRQLFFKLKLPDALPAIFSGIKIAGTYSVLTGVVAEWLGAQKGIGVFMTLAASSYRTPRVFVAIIFTMVLSLAFFGLIVLLERIFIKVNRDEAS